ncbi:patatin-like phospholipase family protein [Mycolicibacterium helvum]|uniref:RpoH suppressor n=1 Tax=Mycolicibacterium helvum TaxID=1534349 RepID=A0A7I7T3P0_9MYCO|nr:patatin-like phospholipase family protein [Mycolicibacterium helvum]BBY62815.1 RpoH suppressor [Mycolicibacterium helvum]
MTIPTTKPDLECDVVMKGGITSGVIYPRAVCTLAQTYRLRSIGGSSAGAIAAAGAAAAEFGRASGGFTLLEALPADITAQENGESVLFRLFQPTKKTLPLYRAFTAGMGKPAGKIRIAVALIAGYGWWALLGAIPGIVVTVACAQGHGLALVAGVLAGVVLALIGAIVGVACGAARTLGTVSSKNFGLCTGMPGAGAAGAPALTPWLHAKFQSMAGLSSDSGPLTFGTLASSGIELRMMTTNITRRQPMPMPWATQEYFFEPDQMRKLFPAEVVDWMVSHPPSVGSDGIPLSPIDVRKRDLLRAQAGSKKPWPNPDDLPVIVSTRMSLSFPLLITAVPLYAVNYSLEANRTARAAADAWLQANPHATSAEGAAALGTAPTFDVNWFSDGGICANLPVHFFDAPLPTRPTFAIDLESFPPDIHKSSIQTENCYLPVENGEGLLRPWTTLPTSGVAALSSFLSQIVDTARGWLDAAQLVMPGYRDRVVTIYHDDTEGGMNLAMKEATVTDLADRGAAAAALLVDKFTGTLGGKPAGWGWENQRWIRFRTSTVGLDEWIRRFRAGYGFAAPNTTPYPALAGPNATADLPSYQFGSTTRRNQANAQTGELTTLADTWATSSALSAGAPRPRPRLRPTPDDGATAPSADPPIQTVLDSEPPG